MRFFSFALLAAVATVSVQAATKEYPTCSPQQSQQYFSALSNDITQCKTSSTYDLAGGSLPSTAQRSAVCKCASLIKQIDNIRVPRCKISLDGNAYKFKDAVESIFAECNGVRVREEPLPASQAGSSDQAEEEESGNEAEVVTTTAPPPARTNGTSSAASGQEDVSAGSIDELPTTAPPTDETEEKTTAPATSAVPTPAPTPQSVATATMAGVMVVTTTTMAAVLLA